MQFLGVLRFEIQVNLRKAIAVMGAEPQKIRRVMLEFLPIEDRVKLIVFDFAFNSRVRVKRNQVVAAVTE